MEINNFLAAIRSLNGYPTNLTTLLVPVAQYMRTKIFQWY